MTPKRFLNLLFSIEPPIPGDINPDWLDEPDDGNEDEED